MLYRVHSNTLYIRAKITVKNVWAKIKPRIGHVSGYTAGSSPYTNFLPLVDKTARVYGMGLRELVHERGLPHPSAHLLLFSPDRRYLLVQCRSAHKDLSANKLAQSVGGHISLSQGMTGKQITPAIAEETMAREAFEEAGIKNLPFAFLGTYAYNSHQFTNQEIVFLFSGEYAGKVRPNPTEVKWMGWFSLKGIMKLAIKKPELFSPSFLKDLEAYAHISNQT
jgi:isopentenyl-diphosphate delta-isomerase